MLRKFHSVFGLVAALLVAVLTVTGAILSLEPVMERAAAPSVETSAMSVGDLAAATTAQHGEVEKIVRSASGSVIVTYFRDDRANADLVDPATGQTIGPYAPSAFMQFVTNLHRSFLWGDTGRAAAGLSALAMVLLSVSGGLLLLSRMGGWKAILKPVRGATFHRLHALIGRAAFLGLLLSALTGCYMSLVNFELISDVAVNGLPAPEGSGGERLRVSDLKILKSVDINDLRELTFPYAGDPTDIYALTTAQGVIQIDASTGEALSTTPHSAMRRIYEFIYMLHTGQGLWPLALALGLSALAAPFLSATGLYIWWKRRNSMPRIRKNAPAHLADTIILVGSEGNATWGFAASLHGALATAGLRVHIAPMNGLRPAYAKAERMLILTSTYGDGAPPASACNFLALASLVEKRLPVAVLGFGDHSFPKFCAFANDVAQSLSKAGWPELLAPQNIDQQSSQAFGHWGESLGAKLGVHLALAHQPAIPTTETFELVGRTDYGAQVQAPTAVLRFALVKTSFWTRLLRLASKRFEPGDYVGILPPSGAAPRYYSIASSNRDGVLEICVRKQPGGLCSTFLHDLAEGATIKAFIRTNENFRAGTAATPLLLIGAGAGIGPLMGLIRQNDRLRPMHLYWGGRSPSSDFLYEDELNTCLSDKRLKGLHTAFSRVPGGGYVQDKLVADGAAVLDMIGRGGKIMVCGGRNMAKGVSEALEKILRPANLTLAQLREKGLYVEDVY